MTSIPSNIFPKLPERLAKPDHADDKKIFERDLGNYKSSAENFSRANEDYKIPENFTSRLNLLVEELEPFKVRRQDRESYSGLPRESRLRYFLSSLENMDKIINLIPSSFYLEKSLPSDTPRESEKKQKTFQPFRKLFKDFITTLDNLQKCFKEPLESIDKLKEKWKIVRDNFFVSPSLHMNPIIEPRYANLLNGIAYDIKCDHYISDGQEKNCFGKLERLEYLGESPNFQSLEFLDNGNLIQIPKNAIHSLKSSYPSPSALAS